MRTARVYQAELEQGIYDHWANGAQNVCAVLPTGGGKTFIFCEILRKAKGRSIVIAHVKEILSQISLNLAENGVSHDILASSSTISECVSLHVDEHKRSFYDRQSAVTVASVDTLVRRKNIPQFDLWVLDEGHHLLKENKWGKVVRKLGCPQGLGVTATPYRADRKGLGRNSHGLYDKMILGPSSADLMEMGYLCPYRVFYPGTRGLDISQVPLGANGDYRADELEIAMSKSQIVGDVVETYCRLVRGKKAVCFANSRKKGEEIANRFKAIGIPAAFLCGYTPARTRHATVKQFAKGEIQVLVNVNLFGEGFNLPDVEVVILASATQSKARHLQQMGRGLRPADGKPFLWIIDHVGNTVLGNGQINLGLPDTPHIWSLDAPVKKKKDRDPPMRVCMNPECTAIYPPFYKECPYCGAVPEKQQRQTPEQVAGDLVELDPDVLDVLRKQVIDLTINPQAYENELIEKNVPIPGAIRNRKLLEANQGAQRTLRDTIAAWAGVCEHFLGMDTDASIQKKFYSTFGIDVLSAQALKKNDADALTERVAQDCEALL